MHDDVAVRIAAAQLTGLSRERTVVDAPPFTGLLASGRPAPLSYAVACRPGAAVRDLGDSLEVLRAAFAPDPVRFELIDEACPGAVAALVDAGFTQNGRYPLLTVDTAELIMPPVPAGARLQVSVTRRDAVEARAVASVAFESDLGDEPDPPGDPAGGGSVLARINGRAVAAAFWTPVADRVTEIAGVATLPRYRRRGLGVAVTAAAARAATELAGVTLAWLTPGHDGADRIYRRVGFAPTASAVHLTAP